MSAAKPWVQSLRDLDDLVLSSEGRVVLTPLARGARGQHDNLGLGQVID